LTARNSGVEATRRATIPRLVAKAQIVCPLAIPRAVNSAAATAEKRVSDGDSRIRTRSDNDDQRHLEECQQRTHGMAPFLSIGRLEINSYLLDPLMTSFDSMNPDRLAVAKRGGWPERLDKGLQPSRPSRQLAGSCARRVLETVGSRFFVEFSF
jgi:hypothetical protein